MTHDSPLDWMCGREVGSGRGGGPSSSAASRAGNAGTAILRAAAGLNYVNFGRRARGIEAFVLAWRAVRKGSKVRMLA
jgi:hypothetical protein